MAPKLTPQQIEALNNDDLHARYFATAQVGEICGETNSGVRDYTRDGGDTVWYVMDGVDNFHFWAKQVKTPENRKLYGMHNITHKAVNFPDSWDMKASRERLTVKFNEAKALEALEIEGHISKAEGVSACRHGQARKVAVNHARSVGFFGKKSTMKHAEATPEGLKIFNKFKAEYTKLGFTNIEREAVAQAAAWLTTFQSANKTEPEPLAENMLDFFILEYSRQQWLTKGRRQERTLKPFYFPAANTRADWPMTFTADPEMKMGRRFTKSRKAFLAAKADGMPAIVEFKLLKQLATVSRICAAGMEAEAPNDTPTASNAKGYMAAPRVPVNQSVNDGGIGKQDYYKEWLPVLSKFGALGERPKNTIPSNSQKLLVKDNAVAVEYLQQCKALLSHHENEPLLFQTWPKLVELANKKRVDEIKYLTTCLYHMCSHVKPSDVMDHKGHFLEEEHEPDTVWAPFELNMVSLGANGEEDADVGAQEE